MMRRTNAVVQSSWHEDEVKHRTLGQQLDSRLSRLLQSIGQQERIPNALRVAHLLTRSWRDELTSGGPIWPSEITDDHTPFEFSLALNGRAEKVRILTEPQDTEQPSLAASWRLAAEVHEELASCWGAGFHSYSKIADLFEPTPSDDGPFSVWHSAILEADGPQFKVYLNPAVHGGHDAVRVLSSALDRLGLTESWAPFARDALKRGELDQPMYFSLDLVDAPHARVKVYVAHRNAGAQDIIEALARCPGFDAASIRSWLEQLMGSTGPFLDRPPISCFALDGGRLELHSATLHLPVRCYLAEDFEIARRICRLLRFPQQVSFMRALTVTAERPLELDRGLQTYVSLRASPGREAVTIYLAPQVYSPAMQRGAKPGWASFKATG